MSVAWLDVSIFQCPSCGRYYSEASWYAVELEADIECGDCHTVFNAKEELTDRVMVQFPIDDRRRAVSAVLTEHIRV